MLETVPVAPRQSTSPQRTATDFYASTGRKIYSASMIGSPRISGLDRFRMFTGGDNEPFVPLAHSRRLTSGDPQGKAMPTRAKTSYNRSLEHRKATLETQLVTTAAGLTLKGDVDFDKLADIRRTLRRRYFTRSNFRALFNEWDLGSLGVIRPEDVHEMMSRLGIPVNMDEANVLVASSCKTRSGVLSLEEFIELINDENDELNVEIATIDPKQQDYQAEVAKLSSIHHSVKLQNTLRQLLQDRHPQISALLYRADNTKCGVLTHDVFCETIFKLGFPPHIANPTQLSALYKDFGGDYRGISYKAFCEQLKVARIGETLSTRTTETVNPVVKDYMDQFGARLSKTAEGPRKMLILDPRAQPPNKLHDIHSAGARVKARLMKQYRTEDNLAEELGKLAGGQCIDQGTLADFVRSTMQGSLTKQGLERFLSTFVYNHDGQTDVGRLAKYIFADELEAVVMMEAHYRGVPLARTEAVALSSAALKRMLGQLEARVAQVRSTAGNSLMGMFDLDKDGFVSAGDMRRALTRFDIPCTLQEAQGLVDFFSGDAKGYLSINDLAQSLQLEILETNAPKLGMTRALNISQPGTEFHQSHLSQTQDVNLFISKTRSEFVPKLGTISQSSRYGAKPPHKNTFFNVQADPASPHFIGEDSRFVRKNLKPINLGVEDKAEEQRCQTAKEDRTRQVLSQVESSIANKTADEEFRGRSKLYSQALIKEKYQTKLTALV
jgi:Ca2+-binding EF-hand superfamily protein